MPPRILVADDDAWILRMVTTVLKKRGYEVDTAPDGEVAYERALSNPPDLLITDVMMPNVDGWTLVKRMREHPVLRDVPVVFLTALSSDDDRIHGFRLGADDYLPKPFRFEELDLRVARTLRRTLPAPAPVQVAVSAPPPAQSHASDDAGGGLETALAGDLSEIGLPMLLTMLEMEQKSGMLELTHEQEGVAELYLKRGRVVHATLDYTPGGDDDKAAGDDDGDDEADELSWGVEDAECVYYLLKWNEGRFEFKPGEVATEDRVGASTTQLLMEGARRLDELKENNRRVAEGEIEESATAAD
ncbi:MAG TPA: response regulator [Haliangium sp.]|nr:response regulator [Haliangium sp.]